MKARTMAAVLAAMTMAATVSYGSNGSGGVEVSERLLDAMSMVESGSNDNAKGKSGETGRYQISQIYLDDANRFLGTSYSLEEMTDPEKAKKVVTAYLSHYAANVKDREVTDEILARIHNGGPRGYLKESTLAYWNKVKGNMSEE